MKKNTYTVKRAMVCESREKKGERKGRKRTKTKLISLVDRQNLSPTLPLDGGWDGCER